MIWLAFALGAERVDREIDAGDSRVVEGPATIVHPATVRSLLADAEERKKCLARELDWTAKLGRAQETIRHRRQICTTQLDADAARITVLEQRVVDLGEDRDREARRSSRRGAQRNVLLGVVSGVVVGMIVVVITE